MGEEFKLPASSYEELAKIIKAYGQVNDPTSIEDLNKLCGVSTSQISRNSGFLLAASIIEGGKAKIASEKGKKLARALIHGIADEISRIWREIIFENDFLTKMVTAIKIRNGMDPQSFHSHIAYSSGQNKTQYVKTGSATVVDILKIANLIEEVDGKLIAKTISITNDNNPPAETTTENIDNKLISKQQASVFPVLESSMKQTSGISVNIDIKLVAKVSELDDLGEKIKRILDQINSNKSDINN